MKINAILRDFITYEADPRFGGDVQNAAIDVALEHLPYMLEIAREHAMNPKHPEQMLWHRYWLTLVKYPGITAPAPPEPEPKKRATGRRVSRK